MKKRQFFSTPPDLTAIVTAYHDKNFLSKDYQFNACDYTIKINLGKQVDALSPSSRD